MCKEFFKNIQEPNKNKNVVNIKVFLLHNPFAMMPTDDKEKE